MFSCLGPVRRWGGQKWQGRSGGFSICLHRSWWQFALGGVVETERIECFRELFQWRNQKVLVDWRDAQYFSILSNKLPQTQQPKQHSLMILWFPWVKSPHSAWLGLLLRPSSGFSQVLTGAVFSPEDQLGKDSPPNSLRWLAEFSSISCWAEVLISLLAISQSLLFAPRGCFIFFFMAWSKPPMACWRPFLCFHLTSFSTIRQREFFVFNRAYVI